MFSHFLKKIFSRAVLIALALSLLSFTIAFAASGDLDTTFGDGGKVTTDISGHFSDQVEGLAVQSNGRIVAVGIRASGNTVDFAVTRYLTNGKLDKSFSGDGKLTTDFGGLDEAKDVAIQSDGKIVVSGRTCDLKYTCHLAVARYTTNGSLDTTFGSGGKKVINDGSGSNGSYGGIAIQSDGKIVIAGYMVNSVGSYDFAVYRLKSNGTLDTTFSGDGKLNFGFGSGRGDFATDLILQGSKIVMVGRTCNASYTDCNFAVARLNSNGSLDRTFSGDGLQTTNFGGIEIAYAVAIQSGGKLVVAGEKTVNGFRNCAIARYTTSGSLDTTFGSSGKKVISGTDGCRGVAVKSNKIILAGGTDLSDLCVIRLKSNGALDTTFNHDGIAEVWFDDSSSAYDIVLQADGKYVAGGAADVNRQYDFALARVLP